MKIKARNKKDFEKIIKDLRQKGYFIITFSYSLVELEKGDQLVIVTR